MFISCLSCHPPFPLPSRGWVEMWGPTPPFVQIPAACQWSAAPPTATATPSLDPVASRMLQQYLACVGVHNWKGFFETCGRAWRFNFSCRPSHLLPCPQERTPRATSYLLISGMRAMGKHAEVCRRIKGGLPGLKSSSSVLDKRAALT